MRPEISTSSPSDSSKLSLKKPRQKELSGGCLSLFGLPFFAVGIFIGFFYFSGLVKWWQARAWEEVPCRIETAELKRSSSSEGKDSFKATAVYQYRFAGREYRGEKVSFGTGSDNVGDFQQKAHRELTDHLRQDRPFRCYVNPAQPEESVLYRTLRWQLQGLLAIFVLTFPAVGSGLMAMGFFSTRTTRREAALRENFPGQPWKWKTAWAGGQITQDGSLKSAALISYTVWFWLVVGPLIAAMYLGSAFSDGKSSWLVLGLGVVGLIPTVFAVREFRRRRAAGGIRFELKQQPASPGGYLRGEILFSQPIPQNASAETSLECRKSISRSTDDGNSVATEIFWRHQETVPAGKVGGVIAPFRLPVVFKLPLAPETTVAPAEKTRYSWHLHFNIPGTAAQCSFEVPVFCTGEAPAADAPAEEWLPQVATGDLPALLAKRRIEATFGADGLPQSITCPPSRFLGLILSLLAFNIIWTGVAVLLFAKAAPLPFKLIWSVSAALIWLWVIWKTLYKRSVTLEGTGLVISNRLGPIMWTRCHQKSGIVGFSHDTNMTSGNQQFYRIRLESAIGKKQTLVDGITESNTAAALAGLLEKWKNNPT